MQRYSWEAKGFQNERHPRCIVYRSHEDDDGTVRQSVA
jgi:hypothetical protein